MASTSTSTTATTTTTTTPTTLTPTPASIAQTRRKRRQSTYHAARYGPRTSCHQLPLSLEALDLSLSSPTPNLASLRILVLSYLEELETRLAQLESPSCDFDLGIDSLKSKGGLKVEEARVWVRDGLKMLEQIKQDVCSHLPDLPLDSTTVENYVSSHLPELPDVPTLKEVTAHFPELAELRSRIAALDLSDMRTRIESVCSHFPDLDFHHPLHYLPTLSEHLNTLHSHLSSIQLPSSIALPLSASATVLHDLHDKLRATEFSPLIHGKRSLLERAEDKLAKMARETREALKLSLHGSALITYVDLPEEWRNNPFVTHGYRFIPLNRWPLIIASLFTVHNETLNIHTHLIPFLLWSLTLIIPTSYFSSTIPAFSSLDIDAPLFIFTVFALVCLFSSVVWHTMSGCAHYHGMDLCARIDYVGIGWLISASVGTIVYYGFDCQPYLCNLFLCCCFASGLAGSILPFMDWFNKPQNKHIRIVFFLSLAFTALAPLGTLSYLHSTSQMLAFIAPVSPSLLSYVTGLVFYATNFPERSLPPSWAPHFGTYLGGGSHAVWHLFIVLAISQHRAAMPVMRGMAGMGEVC